MSGLFRDDSFALEKPCMAKIYSKFETTSVYRLRLKDEVLLKVSRSI